MYMIMPTQGSCLIVVVVVVVGRGEDNSLQGEGREVCSQDALWLATPCTCQLVARLFKGTDKKLSYLLRGTCP